MIKTTILCTGSSGNATLVEIDGVNILLDAGISYKKLSASLRATGKTTEGITHILCTHAHTDHHNPDTARMMEKKHNTKVIKTWEQPPGDLSGLPCKVKLYSMYHDVPCMGISLQDKAGNKLALITDTDGIPEESMGILDSVNILLVETNHDIEILASDRCKYDIEQKVRSMETHMSNDQAKDIVAMAYHPGLYWVCGIHISTNANSPEYALQALEHGLPDSSRTQVYVAGRDGLANSVVVCFAKN